jgi:dolichol kinase
VLLVYVLPSTTFGPIPVRVVLIGALAGVLLLEVLRHLAGWELPTIRPHEERRVASFALYAIGLVIAVLAFPEAVAVAVVLGAAFIDPLLGELRLWNDSLPQTMAAGALVYFLIAAPALYLVGHFEWAVAAGLGLVAAVIGVAVEGPVSLVPLDDDLTMTILPGAVLTILLLGAAATGHSLG